MSAGVDRLLSDAALQIAGELAGAAVPAPDGLTWEAEIVVGISGDRPVLGRGDVGATLYDGTAGIALALAAAAVVETGEREAFSEAAGSDAARGAALHALAGGRELLEDGRLGLFDGATCVALAAVTAGRLLGDAGLIERGAALADAVAPRAAAAADDASSRPALDLISGLAGVALGLQSIGAELGQTAAPSLQSIARRLRAEAVAQTWGSAWPSADGGDAAPPLLGLGHGAAGIALALAEIGAASADADAERASADGFEYERGWFDAVRGAWPDLRVGVDGDGHSGWMTAWCHGALGIGLSRLRLASLTGSFAARAEAG